MEKYTFSYFHSKLESIVEKKDIDKKTLNTTFVGNLSAH